MDSQYPIQQNIENKETTENKASVGLCILSVLIPLFGIIYFFCKRKEFPKKAKGCLISALVSAGVNLIISIVLSLTVMGTAFSKVKQANEISNSVEFSADDLEIDDGTIDNDIVFEF